MKSKENALTDIPARDKIQIVRGWLICPVCNRQRIMRVLPTTKVKNLPVYCKVCHSETIVNIPSQEPEP